MFSINDALRFGTPPCAEPGVSFMRVTRSDDNTTQSRDQSRTTRSSSTFARVPLCGGDSRHAPDRSNITASGPGGGFDLSVVHVELVSGDYFETLGAGSARPGR